MGLFPVQVMLSGSLFSFRQGSPLLNFAERSVRNFKDPGTSAVLSIPFLPFRSFQPLKSFYERNNAHNDL
jgi:hypothetical protein